MRTTVDISDELYAHLRTLALQRGTSVKHLIHDAVRRMLGHGNVEQDVAADFPMIRSNRPGSVELTNEMIHDAEMDGL